ncbi:hypothetical protein HPB47_013640, partial [Ixodes persulcatus]
TDKLTRTILVAAKLSSTETADITIRIRRNTKVTAYLAVPDNSCRGIISGVDTRPTAETLTEELRAPETKSSKGKQICGVCLGLGHRTDVCPQPEKSRCTTCGTPGGAMEDHQCKPHCVNCGGEHPAVDPRCPARQRGPYNKKHVNNTNKCKDDKNRPYHCHRPHQETQTLNGRNYQAKPGKILIPPSSWPTTPQDCHVPSPPTERPKHVGRNKSRSSSRSQSRPRTYGESQQTDKRENRNTLPRDDRNETKAGSAIYAVAVSSSLIIPEAPSYVAVGGDLEAASPAEAVLVAFCL